MSPPDFSSLSDSVSHPSLLLLLLIPGICHPLLFSSFHSYVLLPISASDFGFLRHFHCLPLSNLNSYYNWSFTLSTASVCSFWKCESCFPGHFWIFLSFHVSVVQFGVDWNRFQWFFWIFSFFILPSVSVLFVYLSSIQRMVWLSLALKINSVSWETEMLWQGLWRPT